MRSFTVVLQREEDGRYSAFVPDLPGCTTMGGTKRQARRSIKEAIAAYVDALRKLGRPVPRRRAAVEVVRVAETARAR